MILTSGINEQNHWSGAMLFYVPFETFCQTNGLVIIYSGGAMKNLFLKTRIM